MKKSKLRKIILYAIGGFVVLPVVVAAGLLLFVDANAYKPRLEAVASETLGMEVKVGGKMGIGLFPGLLITLENVHIRNRGTDFVIAKEARLGIDLLPLLHKEVRIADVALKQPRISIELDHDGNYNFEDPETTGAMLTAFDLAKISISDGTLRYADKQSGGKFEAVNCSLEMSRLRLAEGKSSDLLKHLSFAMELACAEIRKKDLTVSDFKLSGDGVNGVFTIKPVQMGVFAGQGSGSIHADFTGAVPHYQLEYSLAQFRLEQFYKTLSPEKFVEGPMDFSANLTMQGKTVKELMQTASGEATLRGDNLTLSGSDLDLQFSRYESSQSFNLVDVGAFIFAGPAGLAVTKGYDFASVLKATGGSSTIRMLVSNWKVEHGVAHALDVAMATNAHRIALLGGLDIVNERFDDVTVALIDSDGCAKVRQKLHGPFQKPVVEQPNILKTLAGPALKLLKKGRDILPGGKCEVFYTGSVAPPK